MKRHTLTAVLILTLIAVTAAFAGCLAGVGTSGDDVIRPYREAYEKIQSAEGIEQTIEITEGKLVVFERKCEYVKNGDIYNVQATEKRLNNLTAEEAYTRTEENATAPANEFKSKINLNEEYFLNVKSERSTFTAEVKSGNEKNVFSLTELSASDMKIALTLSGEKLTKFETTYKATEKSKTYSVSVTISFVY